MKLPTINGNEIVPVRLIPIITHGTFGQETLPGILANRVRVDRFPADPACDSVEIEVDGEFANVSRETLGLSSRCLKDIKVSAYHLNDGEPVKMLPVEWDDIYHDISMLEPVMRKKEEKIGVRGALRPKWSLKATKILPPGVFLWRHDLDILWKFHYLFYCEWSGEHPDARTLIYNAYIRPEVRSLCFEGFETLLSTASKLETSENQATLTQKKSNLPDRKGLKVPKEERRKEEDFTRVIKSIFNQLMAEGNLEILRPGNTLEFLKCLKIRVQGLDKMEDKVTTFGEVVEWVKPIEIACIKMQKPRVVRGQNSRMNKPYSRADVSRLLSELRKIHRDIWPSNKQK